MKKQLKICLVLQGNRNWMGGIEYTKNLILALSALPHDVRSSLELSLLSIKTIELSLYEQVIPFVDKLFFMDHLPAPSFLSRAYRILDRAVSGNNDCRYDIFFKGQGFDFVYPFYFNRHMSAPYRYAGWIPDFQHKHLPKFFTDNDIKKRDAQFTQIATFTPLVILTSKTAENDFNTYFPQFSNKTNVLPFKVNPDPSWYDPDPSVIQNKYFLPDKFFIVCNQFWQHKNHATIFKAMHHLQKQEITPALVCTGNIEDHRDRNFMSLIRQMMADLGIGSQVHILGLIPRLDQIQLIRRSIAVLQPSLFEGWSTVIEDARCLGKHILASGISVHKEQNPPLCTFFNPESHEELAHLMAELWRDLDPGPDLDNEKIARQAAVDAVRSYGFRFLDIVKGTS
jgi:glycosyltransferase involved in cell wall biosynthesis